MARSKSAAKKSAAKKAGKTRKSRSAAKKASKTRKRQVARKKAAPARKKPVAAKKASSPRKTRAPVAPKAKTAANVETLLKRQRMPEDPPGVVEIDERIAIVRTNLREHSPLRRFGRRTAVAAHRRTGSETRCPEEATRRARSIGVVTGVTFGRRSPSPPPGQRTTAAPSPRSAVGACDPPPSQAPSRSWPWPRAPACLQPRSRGARSSCRA